MVLELWNANGPFYSCQLRVVYYVVFTPIWWVPFGLPFIYMHKGVVRVFTHY